jgi:hypothetical protein
MAGTTGGESAGEKIVEKPHFTCMTFSNKKIIIGQEKGGEEQFNRDTCNVLRMPYVYVFDSTISVGQGSWTIEAT